MKDDTPLAVPVLASLPVFACMAILGLPALGHGYAAAYRALYFGGCAVWTMPLAPLQRTRLRLAQALADARDAELRALRLQVNPHFLFNALNAVPALVAAGANRMIASVSGFLRATLAHDDRHEHTLAEELALTEAYLDIEKARLGERLQLAMKAGPDLLDAAVPYLMLQPLVENAVRHGIAPLATPGRIDIGIARAGATLHVDVRNDGIRPTHDGGAQRVDAGWGDDGRFHVRLELPLNVAAA